METVWLHSEESDSGVAGASVDVETVSAGDASVSCSAFGAVGALSAVGAAGCGVTAAGGGIESGVFAGMTGMFVLTSWLMVLVGTFNPRTTSERRTSMAVSPWVLTTEPGRGGKLDVARSNFGVGSFISITAGFVVRSSSLLLLMPRWMPLLPRPAPLESPLGMTISGEMSLRPKEARDSGCGVDPVVPSTGVACGLMEADVPVIRTPVTEEGMASPD